MGAGGDRAAQGLPDPPGHRSEGGGVSRSGRPPTVPSSSGRHRRAPREGGKGPAAAAQVVEHVLRARAQAARKRLSGEHRTLPPHNLSQRNSSRACAPARSPRRRPSPRGLPRRSQLCSTGLGRRRLLRPVQSGRRHKRHAPAYQFRAAPLSASPASALAAALTCGGLLPPAAQKKWSFQECPMPLGRTWPQDAHAAPVWRWRGMQRGGVSAG